MLSKRTYATSINLLQNTLPSNSDYDPKSIGGDELPNRESLPFGGWKLDLGRVDRVASFIILQLK
jgi:hypothetical protein